MALALGLAAGSRPARADGGGFGGGERGKEEPARYVRAGDRARQAHDFLAVIDFGELQPV